jgi:hypothetical protein
VTGLRGGHSQRNVVTPHTPTTAMQYSKPQQGRQQVEQVQQQMCDWLCAGEVHSSSCWLPLLLLLVCITAYLHSHADECYGTQHTCHSHADDNLRLLLRCIVRCWLAALGATPTLARHECQGPRAGPHCEVLPRPHRVGCVG